MDPNANLKEQAELILAITPGRLAPATDKRRLRELRWALHDWLAAGGFAPDWDAYHEAAKAYRWWAGSSPSRPR